jgi:hypothetical protein
VCSGTVATNNQEDAPAEATEVDDQDDSVSEQDAEPEHEERSTSAYDEGPAPYEDSAPDEGEAVDTDAHHSGDSPSPEPGPREDSPSPPAMAGPQMVPPSNGDEETQAAGGRRAHLTLSRIEPWSVMKFSFVMSLVCFIILFVAVAVVYAILSSLGVFDAVTDLITSLTDNDEGEDDLGLQPATWFSPARVLGYTGLLGALNIILITALSTVGAMLYNLAADLVGGLDITLSESE